MKHVSFLRIWLALAVIFLLFNHASALDLDEKVVKKKLPNGLTVLMLERPLSPTVSLYIRYRVGAVDEEPGHSGAAHFLEHMMFKGTPTIGSKDYPNEKKLLVEIEKTGNALDRERQKAGKANHAQIDRLTQKLHKLQNRHKEYFIPNEIDRLYTQNGGLDMNASTGQDVTTYHVSLPANKIELWARIESDRLLNPVFREFYTERDVVLEERRQRVESSPNGKLYEAFMKTAYRVHPYGTPVLGWEEDIRRLSPEALRKIHKKYISPDNIVIAVVGDIHPENTYTLIERYFGRIPARNAEKKPVAPESKQTEERRVDVVFNAEPMLMIGFHKPNAPAGEDYAFDMLETILTKGRTSLLYDHLVTRLQIAKSVGSYNGIPGTRYPNLFMIYAEPRHPHTNAELVKIIFDELEKIKTQAIPDDEIARAKNRLRMDYIQSLNSNAKIASLLSYYEVLLGDYRYFSGYLDRIEKLTAEDIQAIVRQYLDQTNRTVAFLGNTAP